MRETRQSGSEGGGAGTNRLSLPLFLNRPSGTGQRVPVSDLGWSRRCLRKKAEGAAQQTKDSSDRFLGLCRGGRRALGSPE